MVQNEIENKKAHIIELLLNFEKKILNEKNIKVKKINCIKKKALKMSLSFK